MSDFHRKICALLGENDRWRHLQCLQTEEGEAARRWWERHRIELEAIASASDRVNLDARNPADRPKTVKHPISGQPQILQTGSLAAIEDFPDWIEAEPDAKTVFWWLWRFEAERQRQNPEHLLHPQHDILPDCPIHSYRATVSALAGAVEFDESGAVIRYPHILLFTFSPIQDFIKASRKFLDFWAGSYLLHYLSAKLCWHVAETFGPDAIITPSLWGQEIIDALLAVHYPGFDKSFREFGDDGNDPIDRFEEGSSTSLATAGFPNTIAVLVGGKECARELGETLCKRLREEWKAIADKVREGIPEHPVPALRMSIRDRTIAFLTDPKNQGKIDEILEEFGESHDPENRRNIRNWQQPSCWGWRYLWNAQIEQTWQPYWTAVPLGDPNTPLGIIASDKYQFDENWIQQQEKIAQTRGGEPPPTPAEMTIYHTLNDGTWWGSIQARCAQAIQAIKNTRTWEIPVAPGVRSSLSGQLSALHPQFQYRDKFREGWGLPAESMRLFWRVMAEVYPGLFDGSEMLNALELTKRMAWVYGGVGASLGVDFGNLEDANNVDYSQFIRFPNLSAIAAARFSYRDWRQNQNHGKVSKYWRELNGAFAREFDKNSDEHQRFKIRTRGRRNQIPKTDFCINPDDRDGRHYNGAMFSSKWLADDMGLNREGINRLRPLVEAAHRTAGFGEGSPGDWWVIVLGDGDGMGQYVSGKKLHPYRQYLTETNPDAFIDRDRYPDLDDGEYELKKQQFIEAFSEGDKALLNVRKRMGPATHVGLNRALLDFSNRLVPFITEKRFCGRVVYSGGDDVMAVLPLEDLPDYLLSLRAAWCGGGDPYQPQPGDPDVLFESRGGYWLPTSESDDFQGLPNRPLFTMGEGATMSLGIVIAHKSVPLPAALEALWEAEGDRAKEMKGTSGIERGEPGYIAPKNGLCFRVLYGSGNCLEALIKGELYEGWRRWMNTENCQALSGLLYRLAEELPRRAAFTPDAYLIAKAAGVIARRRDDWEAIATEIELLLAWLENWEDWARPLHSLPDGQKPPGIELADLGNVLRFSAFWLDKMQQREEWGQCDPQISQIFADF